MIALPRGPGNEMRGGVMPEYALAVTALVLALGLALLALGVGADRRARSSMETVEQIVPCGTGNLAGDECL